MNRPRCLATLLCVSTMILPSFSSTLLADAAASRVIVRFTDSYAGEARQLEEALGDAGFEVTLERVLRRRTDLLGNSLRFRILHREDDSETARAIRDIVSKAVAGARWGTTTARPLVGTDGRIFDPRGILRDGNGLRSYLVYLYPENDDSLFFEAAAQGDAGAIRRLLEAGMDVNSRNYAGSTALMIAAREGNTEVVDVLLSAGADVNVRNDHDTTALLNAVYMNHLEVVRLLIGSGADASVRNIDGSALEIAFDLSHLAIAVYLRDQLERLEI